LGFFFDKACDNLYNTDRIISIKEIALTARSKKKSIKKNFLIRFVSVLLAVVIVGGTLVSILMNIA
jgi:hypothetical protein